MEPGWSYFVPLPSGWNAAFGHGGEMSPSPMADGDRVKWLFQRIGYAEHRPSALFGHSAGFETTTAPSK